MKMKCGIVKAGGVSGEIFIAEWKLGEFFRVLGMWWEWIVSTIKISYDQISLAIKQAKQNYVQSKN